MKQRYTIVAHCFDRKGTLLSCATNSYEKTHPIQKYFAEKVGHSAKIYLHAEIAALLKAKDSKVHTMRVFRSGNNGQTLLAKPCPICMEALKAFGIRELYYTTNSGTTIKEVLC